MIVLRLIIFDSASNDLNKPWLFKGGTNLFVASNSLPKDKAEQSH